MPVKVDSREKAIACSTAHSGEKADSSRMHDKCISSYITSDSMKLNGLNRVHS